ncbi:flagellar basal body rod protein FlgC [Oscillospiraceae bacterium CM]|nr:flagellar basal body rod protein FlgC [Oscillospiraceae bacterium CM]
MGFLSGMDISGSGLTAQRMRMDVISDNIANVDTTRTADGTPYTKKYVVLAERSDFAGVLKNASGGTSGSVSGGVRVTEIGEDTTTPYQLVYDPTNPDAGEDGYVRMPNVDITQEMVDMISAYRSYEANVTAFNAYKDMAIKSLEIGK